MRKFTAIESAVLESVIIALHDAARVLCRKQLQAVTMIQRHASNKEVNLHCGRLDDEHLFPRRHEELLAMVTFDHAVSDPPMRAGVWLAGGHVFSLMFNVPPSTHNGPLRIARTTILIDPMQPTPTPQYLAPESLTGWLQDWHRTWRLADIRPPLSYEEQVARRRTIFAQLPDDYIAMLHVTDGFSTNGWRSHGLSELRTIALDEHNIQVLAESDIGVIAVKVDSTDPELCFYGFEEQFAMLGRSFHEAMRQVIASNATGAGD